MSFSQRSDFGSRWNLSKHLDVNSAMINRGRIPSPSPSISNLVDPELTDAKKKGNNYHITMNLNALMNQSSTAPNTNAASATSMQQTFRSRTSSRQQQTTAMTPPGYLKPFNDAGLQKAVSIVNITNDDMVFMPQQLTIPPHTPTYQSISFRSPSPNPYHSVANGFTIASVSSSGVHSEQDKHFPVGNNKVGFNLELQGNSRTTFQQSDSSWQNSFADIPLANPSQSKPHTNGGTGRRYNNESNPRYDPKARSGPGREIEEIDAPINSKPQFSSGRNERDEDMPDGSRPYNHDGSSFDRLNGQYDPRFTTEQINDLVASALSHNLIKDPPGSKGGHRVEIEQGEAKVIGPLSSKEINDGFINVDIITEKVDVLLKNGMAQVVVKVKCERVIPIPGSSDLFKKSSVVASKVIDVNLTLSRERQYLYDRAVQQQQSSADGRLSQRETFELYKALMQITEIDQGIQGSMNNMQTTARQSKNIRSNGRSFETGFDADSDEDQHSMSRTSRQHRQNAVRPRFDDDSDTYYY